MRVLLDHVGHVGLREHDVRHRRDHVDDAPRQPEIRNDGVPQLLAVDDHAIRAPVAQIHYPLGCGGRIVVAEVVPALMDADDQREAPERRPGEVEPEVTGLVVDHVGLEGPDAANRRSARAELPGRLSQPW